jgi:hypothetical protein
MKKITALTIAIFAAALGWAQAGPHPHGPFPKHPPQSGKMFLPHHNPHKPGPGSQDRIDGHFRSK